MENQNEEKMKDIISKFLTKANRNKKNIYFLYNGQIINEDVASNPDADATDDEIKAGIHAGNDDNAVIKTVSITHDLNGWKNHGYIEMKNYTPKYPLTTDADVLHTKSDETDFGALYSGDPVDSIGGSKWTGDELRTNPDYIDPEFISDVYKNNQKIHGVPSRVLSN